MRLTSCSRRLLRTGLLVAAAGVTAAVAAAQPAGLAMLDTLARGSWTLHIRDDGSQERICLRNGTEFIQLRHRQRGCTRFVAKSGADEVIVQYTCPGSGYGRTTIRRESAELVQIQSQGFQNGRPFSFSGEGRRTGRC